MLQELWVASLEVGLKMNMTKTQLMCNSTKRKVEVGGQIIHYVNEYTYLGQIASFENRQDKEVERRIQNAWKSFWSMKELMKGDLPLTLKRKLVDVYSARLNLRRTNVVFEAQKSKLKVCQRAMERSILGVKKIDRIRNTTLRSKTGIIDVGKKSAKLKWDWAGHVCRMGKNNNELGAKRWSPPSWPA
ncbi:hypothetical protein O0L34_g7979 [Tuta absoluta]|nr:hypothetical protein O0L34_g7979 [Tuta absoluta]